MIAIAITLITFVLMEGVTWLTHRFVMHGLLWILHEDHHNKNPESKLEKNDWFFVIFAVPAMFLIGTGTYFPDKANLAFIGAGITMYGMAYFIVHEVIIHRRFRWLDKSDNVYVRAIRKAHKVHHKHLGKEDGECFGMLLVPVKYFKEAWRTR